MADPKPTKQPTAKSPGPAKEIPAAQSPDDLVRVYNRSKKQYAHDRYLSLPNAFITVPRSIGELWVREYPHDFVAGDEALKAIDPAQADVLALKEKQAQLEADKAQLDLEVAELKKQLEAARAGK